MFFVTRKMLALLLFLIMMLGLTACQAMPQEGEVSKEPLSTMLPGDTEPILPATNSDISKPEETPETVDWAELYLDYCKSNREILEGPNYPGFTGAGFIDLDLDNVPELVLFDTGASAAMGVSLFDIVEGQVQCISSSSSAMDDALKSPWYSNVVINAHYFEDFMLYRSTKGDCFCVNSGNGAEDFYYRELIRFGRGENGGLTLESLAFQYVENDLDGNEVSARYTLSDQESDKAAYDTYIAQFEKDYVYSGYEPAGVFIWGEERFDPAEGGLLEMVAAAVDVYVPAP